VDSVSYSFVWGSMYIACSTVKAVGVGGYGLGVGGMVVF